jgi:membrane-bound lytic murein transglycosylase B
MAHDCRRSGCSRASVAALKSCSAGPPLRDLIGAAGETARRNSCRRLYKIRAISRQLVDLRPQPRRAGLHRQPAAPSSFQNGAPYGEGTANFEAMHEWNRATIYRKTIGYFADQLVGR